MHRLLRTAGLLAFLCAGQALAQDQKQITYEADIKPIIQRYCLPCHLEESENPSQLNMDTFGMLMKGGKNGVPVVPGRPDSSLLYIKMLPDPPFGRQMPRNRKKVSEEDIRLIREWISQGAAEK